MKVFKLKDTEYTGSVIINIGSKKLSNSEHEILTKVPGDIFLIFPESITRVIDPYKFSNLYGATWYGVYKGDEVNGFWGALDYLESLTKYTSFSVFTTKYFIKDEIYKTLERLQYSGIETSVFKSRDLSMEEKANLYTIKPKIYELAFGVRFKRYGKNSDKGSYSRSKATDPILFLKKNSIRDIRKKLSPKILHSFYGLGIESLIASLITPETYINVNIDEAHI